MIEFTVYGQPVALPRSRGRIMVKRDRQGEKRQAVHIYVPRKDPVQLWKANIRTAYMTAGIDKTAIVKTWPVRIELMFYMNRPRRLMYGAGIRMSSIPHIIKPDVDNLAKAALDALKDLFFDDDKQIYSLMAEKWYAAIDHEPRMVVRVAYTAP